MSGIVPDYQGKRRTLAKRECSLLHAIKHGHTSEKLARASEKVREAKVRLYEAQRDRICPTAGAHALQIGKFGAHIEEWLSMPVEAIIAQYARQLDDKQCD